jgi:hypothetical protein
MEFKNNEYLEYTTTDSVSDDLFTELADSAGLSSVNGQNTYTTLTFGFDCGCESCLPLPKTVEEARAKVEAVLDANNVDYQFIGVVSYCDD